MDFIEVKGDSMIPLLKPGQIIITTDFNPQKMKIIPRGTIVTFKFEGLLMIKRIIGLPHESLTLDNGKLYVDDKKIEEEYLNEDRNGSGKYFWNPIEDEYIVLGDNGVNSMDSRRFGKIDKSEILGVAKFRIWPPKFL